MSMDSSFAPSARIRHDIQRLVSRTAAHKDRLDALATSAERDMRYAERGVAEARDVSAALRHVLAGNLLDATHRSQTSKQLCICAREQHLAALQLLNHLDEEGCEADANVLPRPHAVLVVDDSADIRALVADVLNSAGFVVQTATNGLEGLIAACTLQPGVIVMDVMMPVLNGIEATRLIKAHEPTRRARVIAYTGNESVGESLHEALFVGVLQKPATPDAVLDAVRRAASL
jgi:CheY-like chemotaxis protein